MPGSKAALKVCQHLHISPDIHISDKIANNDGLSLPRGRQLGFHLSRNRVPWWSVTADVLISPVTALLAGAVLQTILPHQN